MPPGACAATVVWRRVTYFGGYTLNVEAGNVLGEGIAPDECCDAPGECRAGVQGRPVTIRAIAGVDPIVAVLNDDDPANSGASFRVYTAPGYFVQLPSHPLHEAIFGSPEAPDELASYRDCSQSLTITGEIAQVPSAVGSLLLRVREPADSDAQQLVRDGVIVDAHTKVEGFDRGGLPFVEKGDSVTVELRSCATEDGRRIPVASSITRPS